jgi:tRNA threonylcarbamoyladenosine biosynthesis protein TsaE
MTVLKSEIDTQNWGLDLAESLTEGTVIALCGNLGAGKTQMTKGIVRGLRSSADVTSPTFTLVHEYTDGRLPVFHFDFYRMESAGEVLSLGWDEYLDEKAVVIVEWADRFANLMPPHTRWIRIEALTPNTRTVEEGYPRS